jgi:hypothetical protein
MYIRVFARLYIHRERIIVYEHCVFRYPYAQILDPPPSMEPELQMAALIYTLQQYQLLIFTTRFISRRN